MSNKAKRMLSTMLALAIVLSLMVAIPLTAGADNAESLKTKIESFAHGGEGELEVYEIFVNPITLRTFVHVRGTVTGAVNQLILNIDSDVTVLWKADYSGSMSDAMLELTGSGTFEVESGGSITNGNGDTIRVSGANAEIVVSGGAVSTGTTDRSAIYIHTTSTKSTVDVSGGTVSATGDAYGIFSDGAEATINVSSGTVSAEGRSALHTRGEKSTVNVSGGTVRNTATSNFIQMYTIFLAGETAVVNISGGTVSAWHSAVSTEGVINMSGGTVSTTTGGSNGCALSGYGGVNMTGGTVSAATGSGIGGMNITVSGGTVSAETGAAIRSGVGITVSGGTVSATTGYAIEMYNIGNVYVTGGFVFAYAPDISGTNNVIRVNSGALNISDEAVVCAWDKDAGHSEYADGTTDDLIASPAAASVAWGLSGSQYGVDYANGANTGFFQISGVHVNAMANVAPTITGPTTMTLAAGYAATSTGAFTVTGTPEPDVEKAGNAAITWNGATKKLNIAAGLPAGTYPVTLTASNGTLPNATLTFTLKVEAAGVAPTITGPTTMALTAGYAACSTGAYTLTGTPEPDVEKTSGNAAIVWNGTTKKLDIAAGLAAGMYAVTLTATNGIEPDANLTFFLTVAPGGGTATTPPFPFTDVTEGMWFYGDVKTAWEQGLINGKTATLFMPEDNLTYAEAVKLAACMHQMHATGSVTLANGSPNWWDSFAAYATANGIISHDYDWNTPATRAGYMEIFANALPAEALAAINTIADGSIPDVPMTHPQAAAIYKLYRAGIVQGVDAAHNCNPGANIKRSEVAAILTRMMNDAARIRFDMP